MRTVRIRISQASPLLISTTSKGTGLDVNHPLATCRNHSQIFEILTYDPDVLHPTPSWKHWDFSLPDDAYGSGYRPPSAAARPHPIALSHVYTRWRALASPLEYRRILIQVGRDVEKALGGLRFRPGAEGSVKRLDLVYKPPQKTDRTWDDGDLKGFTELVNRCSNLEVFWSRFDRFYPPRKSYYADILRIITSSRKTLKWLHWQGNRAFLANSEWSATLTSLSALETLEIEFGNRLMGHNDPIIISLPSLKYLRVSGQGIRPSDIIHWALPSLTALHLPTTISLHLQLPELITKFGPSLKLLNLNSPVTYINKLDMLAGTSLVELGFWNTIDGSGKPSAPLPSISTVVVQVLNESGLPIDIVRHTLTGISWVNKSSFAELQEVTIVGGTFEDMDSPYHVSALGEDDPLGLACRRWDKEEVRVVNQRGTRVWRRDVW